MELPIEKLRNRFQDNWLLGDESQSQTFISLTETLFQEIAEYPPQKILLSEPNPIRFLLASLLLVQQIIMSFWQIQAGVYLNGNKCLS